MKALSGFDITLPAKINLFFGGFHGPFGWGFFSFGMIFMLVFGTMADWSFIQFRGDVAQVQGELIAVEDTNAQENDRPIYAYHYRFYTPQEQAYQGLSYARYQRLSKGDTVTVEYVADTPELSRILNMRRNIFPAWVLLLISIFPLVGVGFIVYSFKRGRRALGILRDGVLVYAELVDKQPTNTRINKKRVYSLTFAYKDHSGRELSTEAKTHETHKLEDEHQEPLIYARHDPQQAVLVDNLPGSPKIDNDRTVRADSLLKSVALLVLPAIGVGFILLGILMIMAA
jgi:hypothetical protein